MNNKETITVTTTINGSEVTAEITPLETLAEFLRNRLGLTGTHLGCEVGSCGACTTLIDSRAARSCLTLAVQANGRKIVTVEGLSIGLNATHPLQKAFIKHSAMQCGFCTPGVLIAMIDFLESNPNPTRDEIRAGLDSNVCRCGAYQNIVDAVFETSRARTKAEPCE
jgi:aerobic-type carbon monoxide dehydrogenase small subunit (CoxS/CutS family)